MSERTAPAGDYVLTAGKWRQSIPGKKGAFRLFRQGDIVTLTDAQAERLTKAGAVRPVAAKKADGDAGGDAGSEPPSPEPKAPKAQPAKATGAAKKADGDAGGDGS